MSKVYLFLCLISVSFGLNAQEYLGRWTSHLPYNQATGIAVAGNKVFSITSGGLFYVNKTDNTVNKFSKENGLSDTQVSTIAYNSFNSSLFIAYKNANIDIVKDNVIFNLPDIKSKSILGDKNIYHIYFDENLAYLSCGFGIVVLDTEKKEIKETYLIGQGGGQLKINAVTSYEGLIYAATDEGLYFADLNSVNLSDFNNWKKHPRFNQPSQRIPSLISGTNAVYLILDNTVSASDSLYFMKNGNWELYPYFQHEILKSLNTRGNRLIINSQFHVDIFSENGDNLKHLYVGRPIFSEEDEDEVLWIADQLTGLIKNPDSGKKIPIIPDGPPNINTANLEFNNGLLLGVAGGTNLSYNNLFRSAQVYSYANNDWNSILIDSLKDLVTTAIDPSDTSHFFAGSWGYGLLEFRNKEMINHFTDQNSSLQSVIPGGYFFRLGGIAFDNQKNLWITNGGVAEPISVYTAQGDWISYPVGSLVNSPFMSDILITQNNHKWIILSGGYGLFVFDDKGTLENHDDDDMKKVSVVDKNNKVITNEIYSIAEDRKGNIWLGTNKGILVYYSPSRVFSGDDFYAQQIIIPRNDDSGNGDPLLETESVTAIEVDGANRKWIGTRGGGVFLVSEDGLEEIHAFNTENSPLLSNSISDIAINDKTGEVYMATDNGIISFVSDATEPSDIFKDVYVFPNPVREDYLGDIVITGLMENSWVKITDLNGNLVFESRSLGGQAIWNGNNLLDERVATGVYLVFCSSEDGLQTHVTKLLFIH